MVRCVQEPSSGLAALELRVDSGAPNYIDQAGVDVHAASSSEQEVAIDMATNRGVVSVADQIEQLLGIPEVDCAVECFSPC